MGARQSVFSDGVYFSGTERNKSGIFQKCVIAGMPRPPFVDVYYTSVLDRLPVHSTLVQKDSTMLKLSYQGVVRRFSIVYSFS